MVKALAVNPGFNHVYMLMSSRYAEQWEMSLIELAVQRTTDR